MGFQSDIYLGWDGFDKIKEVFPEFNDKAFEDIDGLAFKEIPNGSIHDFLSEKYEVKIPKGYLTTSHQAFHGPDEELGIEEKDTDLFILGVNLTSRYRPVFLDFRDPHGGLHIKKFDKNLLEDIEWYRNYLINNVDKRYESADVLVKDNWY